MKLGATFELRSPKAHNVSALKKNKNNFYDRDITSKYSEVPVSVCVLYNFRPVFKDQKSLKFKENLRNASRSSRTPP